MLVANIHEAKTNLSSLIAAVLAGKDVVIAKAGQPVVKLVQFNNDKIMSSYGILKGKINVPDNFNDEDEEINRMFYGE